MIFLPLFNTSWFRLAALLVGGSIFLWLRLEDDNVIAAAIGGLLITCLIVIGWTWRKTGGREYTWRWLLAAYTALGGLIGLGTAVSAALLMLIKNGLHAHVFPEFPFGMISGMLALAPIWALGGALIGLGIGAVWIVWKA
ncbi:MAG: hypothetical protein IAE89_06410 [Anaerolineae bacterium]|nr:hypothetical protein [Anaerolineae bacterium]